jgi:hypothetical protein
MRIEEKNGTDPDENTSGTDPDENCIGVHPVHPFFGLPFLAFFYPLTVNLIRWELITLFRHHFGPQGFAANHASAQAQPGDAETSPGGTMDQPDPRDDASDNEQLREWHK